MRTALPSSFAAVVLLLFAISPARAQGPATGQVFTVTSTADSSDQTPGDGVCSDAENRCTLRAAVEEANGQPGADVIIFSLEYPAVIDLTMGPLTITGSGHSIVGPGARRLTVQRSSSAALPFRIFHVPNQGTSAAVRGLTIRNGVAGELLSGGALRSGPGTTVHLADAALLNNSGGNGGAVHNEGTMTITRVLMASNTANLYGGAIATTNTSNTRILNSTLTLNSAQTGGAVHAEAPFLAVNCTITHNSASISASSIRSGPANEVALLNTIVGSDTTFPTISMSGSFLSHGNNIITDARSSTGFTNGVNNDQVSDNNIINPLLGPLADNGGQTDTRALMDGSPAIDTGNSCVARSQCAMFPPQAQPFMFWDQRVGRTRGGFFDIVDIGAFEAGSGGSSGTSGFGILPFPTAASFLTNSQAIITNVETDDRIYRSIGPFGRIRVNGLSSSVVYVLEVRSKRTIAHTAPRVIGVPD